MAEGTTYQPLGFVRKDPNWFYILTKFRGSSSQFGADNFYSSFLASYAVKMSQNRIGQRTPLNFYDHDFHLCWDWDKAESPIGWRLGMAPNPADGSNPGQELQNLSNEDFEKIFDLKSKLTSSAWVSSSWNFEANWRRTTSGPLALNRKVESKKGGFIF